jgi:signal transduction histidine kinase
MSTALESPSPVVLDEHGYYYPMPVVVQGTPIGDYYNSLLRGLTHKLNNFLAVIQGFSSLILMSDGLEQGVRENLDHMKEASVGAGHLAERILAAGGCVRLNLQSVSLNAFVPLIESNLRAPFTNLNVPLQINVAPNLPSVQVDNGRLKEILCEITLNAAEAVALSGKAGSVGLDILPSGQVPGSRPGCLDVFIRNTGATLPPEKLRDFFRPFHSTKDSKHYGIGLTITQMLCAQMGIRMGLKSENETTTVWLSIPAA